MSLYEQTMEIVLARLQAAPLTLVTLTQIKRFHRTVATREGSPRWNLVDVYDECTTKCERSGAFRVEIIIRSDIPGAPVDAHKVEVMRKLGPNGSTTKYPAGVRLVPGRIEFDTDVADLDITKLDMPFRFFYPGNEWTL